MSRVITKAISDSAGNANIEWAKELAKVHGNKSVVMEIEIAFATPSNTNNDGFNSAGVVSQGEITIVSQKNEIGQTTDMFEVANSGGDGIIKLKTGKTIPVITRFILDDEVLVVRKKGHGTQTGDLKHSVVLNGIFLDASQTNTTIVHKYEIMDPINDGYQIDQAANDTDWDNVIIKKKFYENGRTIGQTIIDTFAFGWSLSVRGSKEMKIKKLKTLVVINYYDASAEGGN